jgi:hypothetical protein
MPIFGDKDNLPPQELLPEKDYKFKVVGMEFGFSTGPSTAGSEEFKVKVQIEGKPRTIVERLIDHKSCDWKIDCFLKSTGIKLAKGEAWDFRKDTADGMGGRWINYMGLRGWCRVIVEEYKHKASGEQRKTNKIGTFYTDKEKLPPDAEMQAEKEKEETPF